MLNGWVPNETPWVDRLLNSIWDRLAAAVPEDMLPTMTVKGKKRTAVEYGCGHYGCVLPVGRARTVLKVTSDPTEARFVSVLPTLLDTGSLEGIVEYHLIRAVEGQSRRNRPVFLIWREEARDVGRAVIRRYGGPPEAEDASRAAGLLIAFKESAHSVKSYVAQDKPGSAERLEKVMQLADNDFGRRVLDQAPVSMDTWKKLLYGINDYGYGYSKAKPPYKHPHKAAIALALAGRYADGLTRTDALQSVGHALESLIYQGVLLADVHLNNVGIVDRPDYSKPIRVITDPGHMVLLDERVQPEPIPYL